MVMAHPLVSLQAVRVRKRGQILLGPVDLALPQTGVTILLGPNGAGKTTLLRTLHGLERVASGQIAWAQDHSLDAQAFVFQTPVMMRRSVLANLVYPQRLAGIPKSHAEAEAKDWAHRIGLQDQVQQSAPRLSGGEKQKLALARALIRAPHVLFLDEPCASLDGAATREIETLLTDAHTQSTRIIMSTHNIGQARRLASDVVFMLDGKVLEYGPATTFFEAPKTPQARAFLQGDIVE
ncbi:ATP-binding cassette domain-containing protein [Ascidiaceihabitans donghaensis]